MTYKCRYNCLQRDDIMCRYYSMRANYQPISLLPTLSTVFERVIFNQVYTYFD